MLALLKKWSCNNFTNKLGPYIFHLGIQKKKALCFCVCALWNSPWTESCDEPSTRVTFGACCAVLAWVLSLLSYIEFPPGCFSTDTASASSRQNRTARCTTAWLRPPPLRCSSKPIRSGTNLRNDRAQCSSLTFIGSKCQRRIFRDTQMELSDTWTDKPAPRASQILRKTGC